VEDVDTRNLTDHSDLRIFKRTGSAFRLYQTAADAARHGGFPGRFEESVWNSPSSTIRITVVQPIGGGPSASLGIMANDKIVKIDGKSSIGFNNDQVMKSLKGRKGTKVSVSIARSGVKELLEFEIIRDIHSSLQRRRFDDVERDRWVYQCDAIAETTNKEMAAALQKLSGLG